MHERSLVQGLLTQIGDVVRPRDPRAVRGVQLTIGEFAGIEPELLRWAFEELAPAVLSPDCQLEMDIVPLRARCSACEHEFAVDKFRFLCPACGGDTVKVIAGEELVLTSVTLEPAPVAVVPSASEELR
jgi:hydrogenase nickel incorporation protein HypA/HybF